MSDFNREDRYIVIKRKDLNVVPFAALQSFLEHLGALASFLPQREFVVVESDWPECEQVWRMIEARVTGQPSNFERLEAEAQALREEVARGNRITVSMALDIAAVGEALGIPGEQQEGGTGEFIDLILELKRDAERYRWVKQRAWYVDRAAEVYEIDHIKVAGFKEAVPVDDDDVEAAIDRAMAEGALLGEEKEPSA